MRDAGAEAALIQGDISRWDEIKRMAEEAGDVDVLVNNVGDMASVADVVARARRGDASTTASPSTSRARC